MATTQNEVVIRIDGAEATLAITPEITEMFLTIIEAEGIQEDGGLLPWMIKQITHLLIQRYTHAAKTLARRQADKQADAQTEELRSKILTHIDSIGGKKS